MAEEHAEQQMIERALTRTVESEDEGPLTKIGMQQNTGIRRMGIELPPLNTALVEVHRELATVSMGAKDMAIKNKNVWKTVKLTQAQLQKAQERIAELERTTTTVQQNPGLTSNDDALTTLREEVEAQTAIAAKAKRATQIAKSEIDRLRAELQQLS